MSCVSADDTNFLPTGKKVGRHYLSGVSACSQYNIHKLASLNLPAYRICLPWLGCRTLRSGLEVQASKWSRGDRTRVRLLDICDLLKPPRGAFRVVKTRNGWQLR